MKMIISLVLGLLLFYCSIQKNQLKSQSRFKSMTTFKSSTKFKSKTKFKTMTKFKSKTKFKTKFKMMTGFKNKGQLMGRARFQNKLKFKNKGGLQNKVKNQKSGKSMERERMEKNRIDTYGVRITQKYVINITESNIIKVENYQAVKAVPDKVENELLERIRNMKERQKYDIENMYRSKYDLRAADFSCTGDDMEGELYMIDKVNDINLDQAKQYRSRYVDISKGLEFDKVTINMNQQKFSISDKEGILKEIIYLDTIYPRDKELQETINKNRENTRTRVEEMKIRIINATQVADSEDKKYPEFYCFQLINEPLYQNSLEGVYRQTIQENYKFGSIVQILRDKDRENTGMVQTSSYSNVHDHMYYNLLTLCHNDLDYVERWLMFFNREKFDCSLDYNRANYIGNYESKMYLSGQMSQSSMMYKAEMERQAEIERLEQIKKEQEQKKQMTAQELNKEELTRLSSQLQELTESMSQEQQYSNSEISSEIQRIRSKQGLISNKNEQLQCLEQALQIRAEEEDEEVVKLLKDEEMNKVKQVVSSTREKMKKQYEERIKELKEQLDKQEDSIEQEKSNYDELMVNLIKGGLKKGDKAKCVPDKDIIVDDNGKKVNEQKLEDFMTTACSEILNSADENSMDMQGGLLDRVNQCTKKDLFCAQCCNAQFGFDNIMEKQSCIYECNERMDLAYPEKTVFTAALTGTIDKESNKQMKQKVEQEIMEKTRMMNQIPPARFKQVEKKFMKNRR